MSEAKSTSEIQRNFHKRQLARGYRKTSMYIANVLGEEVPKDVKEKFDEKWKDIQKQIAKLNQETLTELGK